MTFREAPADDPALAALVAAYFDELRERFGAFDPPDAPSMARDIESGCALVHPHATATLRRLDATTAEVKRMFVSPAARGKGIGRALLDAIEEAARTRAYERIVLDTHAALVEAARLYERAGYRRIPPYNDNPYAALWFEKPLS